MGGTFHGLDLWYRYLELLGLMSNSYECRSYVTLGLMSVGLKSVGLMS